ncbi:MAG: hypothetical protein GVY02_01165 [Bacteroidetes bacterium]|nr:hypothetical protein [Bacteroidota bacterium]
MTRAFLVRAAARNYPKHTMAYGCAATKGFGTIPKVFGTRKALALAAVPWNC